MGLGKLVRRSVSPLRLQTAPACMGLLLLLSSGRFADGTNAQNSTFTAPDDAAAKSVCGTDIYIATFCGSKVIGGLVRQTCPEMCGQAPEEAGKKACGSGIYVATFCDDNVVGAVVRHSCPEMCEEMSVDAHSNSNAAISWKCAGIEVNK
eukprot:gene28531-30930_t